MLSSNLSLFLSGFFSLLSFLLLGPWISRTSNWLRSKSLEQGHPLFFFSFVTWAGEVRYCGRVRSSRCSSPFFPLARNRPFCFAGDQRRRKPRFCSSFFFFPASPLKTRRPMRTACITSSFFFPLGSRRRARPARPCRGIFFFSLRRNAGTDRATASRSPFFFSSFFSSGHDQKKASAAKPSSFFFPPSRVT